MQHHETVRGYLNEYNKIIQVLARTNSWLNRVEAVSSDEDLFRTSVEDIDNLPIHERIKKNVKKWTSEGNQLGVGIGFRNGSYHLYITKIEPTSTRGFRDARLYSLSREEADSLVFYKLYHNL